MRAGFLVRVVLDMGAELAQAVADARLGSWLVVVGDILPRAAMKSLRVLLRAEGQVTSISVSPRASLTRRPVI